MLWNSFREYAATNPEGTLENFRSMLAASVQHCERDKLPELARLLALVAGYVQMFGKSKTVSSLVSVAADVKSKEGAKARTILNEDDLDEEDEIDLEPRRRSREHLLGGLQTRRQGL